MDRTLHMQRRMADKLAAERTGVVITGPRKRPPPPVPALAERTDETGPKGELKPAQRTSGGGFAPWVIALFISAVAGFAGYYMMQKRSLAEESLADLQAELGLFRDRAAQSESHAIAARAELARAQAQLSETRQGMTTLEQRMKEKSQAAEQLAARLEGIVGKDQGEVLSENGQLTLRLMDRVLFRSGEAELTPRGMAVMDSVAQALATVPDQQVWVQGHTDDVPVTRIRRQFASNWELSAARALTVVHYLQTQGKVDPRRLAAVAFGEHRPASRRSKAKNRRIEIVLAPRDVKLVTAQ